MKVVWLKSLTTVLVVLFSLTLVVAQAKNKSGNSDKARTEVCHVTSSGRVIVLELPPNAVNAHLRHGDFSPATYYADSDLDGWGHPNESVSSCEPLDDFVENNSDLDDADPSVGRDAAICRVLYYFLDADGDGYGSHRDNEPRAECQQPDGRVSNNEDLNDGDSQVTTQCPSMKYDENWDCQG